MELNSFHIMKANLSLGSVMGDAEYHASDPARNMHVYKDKDAL